MVASATTKTPKKTRGQGQKKRWSNKGAKSVEPLCLDVSGSPEVQRKLHVLFSVSHSLHRSLIRDGLKALDEYDRLRRKTSTENLRRKYLRPVLLTDGQIAICRKTGRPKIEAVSGYKLLQEDVGLTTDGFAGRAKRHYERAGWFRDHITKAEALHIAHAAFDPFKRHLIPDKNGKRAGRPRVTKWHDYNRIPGRARSHTTPRKWESFRLAGTLDGHLEAYGRVGSLKEAKERLPGPGRLPKDSGCSDKVKKDKRQSLLSASVFMQPKTMPIQDRPPSRGGWWEHAGPLMVVKQTNGKEIAIPVRLPQGAGQMKRTCHYLEDPEIWHKIDLVRVADTSAPGGMRYQAHLMVTRAPYLTEKNRQLYEEIPKNRDSASDYNVSVVADASVNEDMKDIRVTMRRVSKEQLEAERKRLSKDRSRQKALDRSRRSQNRDQYEMGARQARRAERRKRAGIKERVCDLPESSRRANKKKVPLQAYRKDSLSNNYRKLRVSHAQSAASEARRKDHVALDEAKAVLRIHGAVHMTEKVDIRQWYRHMKWARRLNITTPGRRRAAYKFLAERVGGSVTDTPIRLACSQRCLCGAKVSKDLSERMHICECGIEADRDAMSSLIELCISEIDVDGKTVKDIDEHKLRALDRAYREEFPDLKLVFDDQGHVQTGQIEGRWRSTGSPHHAGEDPRAVYPVSQSAGGEDRAGSALNQAGLGTKHGCAPEAKPTAQSASAATNQLQKPDPAMRAHRAPHAAGRKPKKRTRRKETTSAAPDRGMWLPKPSGSDLGKRCADE